MVLPAPYFQDESCTIYHGDCRELLPLIGPVDLVLTDPPYGVDRAGWDDRADTVVLAEWVAEWLRISPRVLFTWLARGVWDLGRVLENVAEIYRVLVWHKPMVLNGGRANYTWHWEPVVFAGPVGSKAPGKPFYVPDVISANPPAFRVNPENVAHNSQKPLALIRTLLEPLPAGLVLDPFMGSGTTLRAAKDLGRKAIGIEIEERYCEIAAKRLAQAVLPGMEVA